MLLRDDEHVHGSLRVYVLEGESVRVFVDFLGENFSLDDAAEKAVGHGVVMIAEGGDPAARSMRSLPNGQQVIGDNAC